MKMDLTKMYVEFFLFHPTQGNIGTSIDFGRGSYLIDREQAHRLTTGFYQSTGIFKNNWVVEIEMDGDEPKLKNGFINILEIIS